MFHLTLRKKLLFFSVLLSMLPLGLAGQSMIRITQDELKSAINSEIVSTAEQLARDIDDLYTDTWLAPLRLIASGIDNEQLGPQEKVSLVRAGVLNIADVLACQIRILGVAHPILITRDSFTDRLQEAGLSAAELLRIPEETLQQIATVQPERVSVQEPMYVEALSGWLMTIVVPLTTHFDGRPGFLTAHLSLDRLQLLLENHVFSRLGRIMMVDAAGRRLFDPGHEDLRHLQIVREAIALLGSESRAVSVRPYQRPTGEKMLAGFAFPAQVPWSIIVESKEADAYLAVTRMSETLLLWILAGLAVTIAASLAFALRISRPVEEMARVAQQVGQGNLEITVTQGRSKDEISQLALRMNEMIRGLRERDFIRETFGRYVSPEVAQEVLSDPAALHPGGELRVVTVLLTDLRGFTSLTEQISPAEMIELLNSHLGRMADVVGQFRGTVVEFVGDAILALFGAPSVQDDDPKRAVACAVQMQIEMERFNAESQRQGQPPLQMGIGIATGPVIVGNIGSEKRMKYGAVGDHVNLAARVESFTAGGEVLVSESTQRECVDFAQFRGPIEVQAKGKEQPLRFYAVRSIGEPYHLDVPVEWQEAEDLAEVSLPALCYRVQEKQVETQPIRCEMVRLGLENAEILFSEPLVRFDDIKLMIGPLPDRPELMLSDVYGKVMRVEPAGSGSRGWVRFTSIPRAHRKHLKQLLEPGG